MLCHSNKSRESKVSTAISPNVTHQIVAAYAERSVNLKREDAEDLRSQVKRLREKVETFISEHPDAGLEKLLLFGSLAKGTGLKTLNDVDLAVYVRSDNDAVPVDQIDLIEWLAERIREAYPQMNASQIVPSEYCVTVSFSQSGLNVDVVPVRYEGDPDDRGYLFTRSTSEQVLTSIPLHLQFIRKRKELQPKNFAQAIRLLKWWIKQRVREDSSFEFKSFMAEMVVAKLADDGVRFDDYTMGMEEIFKYIVKSQLRERIAFTDNYKSTELPGATGDEIEIFDPVNPQNNMAAEYSRQQREAIVEAAEDSLDALADARYATSKQRAVDGWKIVLGPSFQG